MPDSRQTTQAAENLIKLVRSCRTTPEVSIFGNVVRFDNDIGRLQNLFRYFMPVLEKLNVLDDIDESLEQLNHTSRQKREDKRGRPTATHKATQQGEIARRILAEVTLRIEIYSLLQDFIINATGPQPMIITNPDAARVTNLSDGKIKALRKELHELDGLDLLDLLVSYYSQPTAN